MSRSLREPSQKEIVRLLVEVERYVAAVDVLRTEGREPVWRAGKLYLRPAHP